MVGLHLFSIFNTELDEYNEMTRKSENKYLKTKKFNFIN